MTTLTNEQQEELKTFAEKLIKIGMNDKNLERGQKTINTYTDLKNKIEFNNELTDGQLRIFVNGSKIFKLPLSEQILSLLQHDTPVPVRANEPTTDDVFGNLFNVDSKPTPQNTGEYITREEVTEAIIIAYKMIMEEVQRSR